MSMEMNQNIWSRRLRPQSFEAVIGQNETLSTLTYLLDHRKLHPALMFHGMRGVGKTSLARIVAKCLNCIEGIGAHPCQVCDHCRAIEAGTHVDVIELDAASRTKVEEMREWLEQLPYAPTVGRMKVFILDEAHMLSRHSFNALLKMLEEPPAHVQFIFATTEPQKLPDTVRSRLLSLALQPVAMDSLAEHLSKVLTQDHIEHPPAFCASLAQASQGSVRDALNLMEQAIARRHGSITDPEAGGDVFEMGAKQGWIQEIWALWYAAAWPELMAAIATYISDFQQADAFLQQGLKWIHAAYLANSWALLAPDQPLPLLDQPIFKERDKLSLKMLWSMHQALVEMRASLPMLPDPAEAMQLMMVRLGHFRGLHPTPQPPLPPEAPKNPQPQPSSAPSPQERLQTLQASIRGDVIRQMALSAKEKSLLLNGHLTLSWGEEGQGLVLKILSLPGFQLYQSELSRLAIEQAWSQFFKQPLQVFFEKMPIEGWPAQETLKMSENRVRRTDQKRCAQQWSQAPWAEGINKMFEVQWLGMELAEENIPAHAL